VERYRGRVYAMAMAVTANADEATELTQETFVRALQSLPRLEEPEKFPSWVRGITYTISQDLRRKAARERRHMKRAAQQRATSEAPVDVDVAARESGKREVELLGEAVGTLPENTRIALDLRYREGLSYAQIGEVLGVPDSTVRGLLYRGTRTLRHKLQPMLKRTRG
jgi:RNA polymerase sigma-70 factor, ECF subfamily